MTWTDWNSIFQQQMWLEKYRELEDAAADAKDADTYKKYVGSELCEGRDQSAGVQKIVGSVCPASGGGQIADLLFKDAKSPRLWYTTMEITEEPPAAPTRPDEPGGSQ